MKWSLIVLVCFVLSLVRADIYADLYALRLKDGQIESLVGIEFGSGYKEVANLESYAQNFTTFHNLTFYDANSEIFVIGNTNPPMLLLVNTYTAEVRSVSLPIYGQLLAMTAYDGIVYVLLGLDDDLPTLGSIVAYDIATGESTRLSKFKILPESSFVVQTTLTWLPQMDVWLFEQMNGTGLYMYMVNANPTKATVYPIDVAGGFESTWFDVSTDNSSVITYRGGAFQKLNLNTYRMSPLVKFDCTVGYGAVDFKKKQVYQLSNCDSPIISSFSWFYNKTLPPMDLDPALSDAVSIASVGTYIPYLCGAPCGTHPDCAGSNTCNTCRLGKCTASGDCNAFCQTGDDCYAGVCVGDCEENRCGKRGCGMKCENHEECEANSRTCQICRLGSCVDTGGCGAYCRTPLDCYAGDCAGNCQNWRCSSNTPTAN